MITSASQYGLAKTEVTTQTINWLSPSPETATTAKRTKAPPSAVLSGKVSRVWPKNETPSAQPNAIRLAQSGRMSAPSCNPSPTPTCTAVAMMPTKPNREICLRVCIAGLSIQRRAS